TTTPTTATSPLSLHDALPIFCGPMQICSAGQCIADTEACPAPTVRCGTGCVNTQNEPGHCGACDQPCAASEACQGGTCGCSEGLDRKSTRLNSSHVKISYAVF